MLDKAITALASTCVALAAVKLSGGGVAGVGSGNNGSISKNKAVVRKLYSQVWNEKDQAGARRRGEVHQRGPHPDRSIPPKPHARSGGVHGHGRFFREAMTELVIAVDDLIAQGVKVVAQISYRAKVGGKEARWTGTAVMEIEDSKIVKSWVNSDSSPRSSSSVCSRTAGGTTGHFERVTKTGVVAAEESPSTSAPAT